MKALVTGSEGFLGRHFALRLLEQGYSVTCVDVLADVPSDALDAFRMDRTEYDLVVHCAARSPHRSAIDGQPAAVGAANLELDAALFRWALQAQPGRVLYFSSSAVYPAVLQMGPDAAPLAEERLRATDPVLDAPDAVYGWTKLTGELLAHHYRAAGGRVTVVRPFSGYGSDQSAEFPFGAFRDRARRREDPFVIWGNGQQVRDFIHVDDLVAGALAAVTRDLDEPVNLCTGIGTSMVDLARMFCDQVGYCPRFEMASDAPGGVEYRVGNPDRLRGFYQPEVDLAEGVARAVEGRF